MSAQILIFEEILELFSYFKNWLSLPANFQPRMPPDHPSPMPNPSSGLPIPPLHHQPQVRSDQMPEKAVQNGPHAEMPTLQSLSSRSGLSDQSRMPRSEMRSQVQFGSRVSCLQTGFEEDRFGAAATGAVYAFSGGFAK